MARLNDPLIPGSPLAYIDKRLIRDGDIELSKFTQSVKDAIEAGGLTEAQVTELLTDGDYTTSSRVNTIVDNAVAHLPTTPVETVTETVAISYTFTNQQAADDAAWAYMQPSKAYSFPASRLMQVRISIGTGTALISTMSHVFDSKEILRRDPVSDADISGNVKTGASLRLQIGEWGMHLARDDDNKPIFLIGSLVGAGVVVELLELEFPTTSGSATGGGPAFRSWNISVAEKNIRFVKQGESGTTVADNLEIVRENLDGKRIVIGGTTTAAAIRVVLDTQGGGGAEYKQTTFLLDNQTNKQIAEFYAATGGGDGNAKFEVPSVPPGSVARISWVANASKAATDGVELSVEVYRGSVENIFPGLGTVTPQLTDYILIGDVSNNEKTLKITLQDLKGIVGGGGGSGATHNRRCAIRAADGSAFVAGDFLTSSSGSRSITHIVTVPTWTSGKRQLAFAVPTSTPDLTGLRPNGSIFNALGGFEKQTDTLAIDGDTYKLWVNPSVFQVTSGTAWEIEP